MNTNNTIILAILDLPVGSVVNLDSEMVLLKRDDFVGFHSIPTDMLHLVTVRAGKDSAVTVGFVFQSATLIRRYDAATEEVSADPVVDAENLVRRVRMNQMEPQRIVSYERFIPDATAWRESTKYISTTLLKRRGIKFGHKLVPGSYYEEQPEDQSTGVSRSTSNRIVDGMAVVYPPIPVMNLSSRHTLHEGTKRFMNTISPAQKTALFTAPPSHTLELLLTRYYESSSKDMLGDVQLSYILFLRLNCFSSLSHWRDLVATLAVVEAKGVERHTELYAGFLNVLATQVSTMGDDFINEISDDNFLVPSLQQLIATVSRVVAAKRTVGGKLSAALANLTGLLETKFPGHFEVADDRDGVDMMLIDDDDQVWNDGNSEDGPVIVAAEEVEAAMARSMALPNKKLRHQGGDVDKHLREQYPILFAAMDPDTEDILMTCARALDEANDVSLVREAAAYLEEVEAKKKC